MATKVTRRFTSHTHLACEQTRIFRWERHYYFSSKLAFGNSVLNCLHDTIRHHNYTDVGIISHLFKHSLDICLGHALIYDTEILLITAGNAACASEKEARDGGLISQYSYICHKRALVFMLGFDLPYESEKVITNNQDVKK